MSMQLPLFDKALSGSTELRQVPDTSEGGESPTCCGFENRHEESGSAHKYSDAWEQERLEIAGVSGPQGEYPDTPGYKKAGTSKDAAEEMKYEASTLRARCFHDLIWLGPSTADELARHINKSVLAIRPRISELLAKGKIEDSGLRRKNVSGKSAIVWRAK
ncbi:MAG TPA: hypothetical protein VFG51_01625 [Candidatus Saccharimonadia bacterium]|nr:hypothetical protein [Candidatus Saccharimonadia bacterium]